MSEEEKKAIHIVENFIDDERMVNKKGEYIIPYKYGQGQRFVFKDQYNAIQTVLNLIEKQDKMIDLMADRITELIEKVYDSKYNKKDVIDIFKNLAVNNLLKEGR